ncbi:MAG: TonB-dependent receptor [Pseudomonadota bacterium]|nr:TonB-dependent receptor [Pseudomonadota bacterium]
MKNISLRKPLSIVIGGLLASAPVYAQGSDTLSLEEIVVTAQKRTENLQDVPASIEALAGEELANAGISDLKSFGQRTPGVVFEQKNVAIPQLAIRGIGGGKPSVADEPTAGVFVDGVYVPRIAGAVQSLANIERLEVLKGPQGTLYGRNTIAGALSIYTSKPGEEFSGFTEVGVGNRDFLQFKGYLEGGITDSLAASVTLSDSFKGGSREEEITGKNDDQDNQFVRTRAVYTPSDTFEADFVVAYSDMTVDANLEEPLNPDENYPFMVPPAAYAAINPALPAVITAARNAATADSNADFYSNKQSEAGKIDLETLTASMTLNWYLSDFEVTSITGYYSYESLSIGDFDGTEFDILASIDEQESTSWSQEVRFASTDGGAFTFDDRLEWMVGLFYFEDDAEQVYAINEGSDFIFNNVTLLGAPILPARASSVSSYPTEIDTQSYAVFGQATYYLNEDWDLTVGLRYSKDKKDYTYTAATDTVGSPIVIAPFTTSDELEFSSLDPKLVLSYQLSDSSLAYLSYSKGYRSGGIQFATPSLAVAEQGFDEETVTSIELGLKSRLMNDRLQINAAVFDYEYQDMQEDDIVIEGGVPVSIIRNVGESSVRGLEVDAKFLAAEDLMLEFSYGYLDSEYTEFVTATEDFSGNSLGLSPEHSYRISAQYSLDLFQGWYSTVRLDYAWKDDFYYNEDNIVEAPDVGLTSVSMTTVSPDEKWQVQLLCSNCTDKEYVSTVTDLGDGHGTQATGDRVRYELNVKYNF